MAGEEVKTSLGQSVVVENRAGASGITGAEYVSRADTDDHARVRAPMFNLSFSDLNRDEPTRAGEIHQPYNAQSGI